MAELALFGREREVGLVDGLVGSVKEQGGALVVTGEAGIGKSSLLAAARREAGNQGMLLLSATGVQSETHLPFAGLHMLVVPILARAEELPPAQRDAFLTAFGMADATAPDRFLIGLAALNLLGDSAANSSLLLLVEDAQWLDRPTCDVLAFVARRLEAEPISMLIAIREGYESPFIEAGLPELPLGPLDEASAGALLDAQAPHLAPAVRRRLLDEADGNPLALIELPAALGSDEGTEGSLLPTSLPLTARLERAFAVRTSELPEVTRTQLLVAAVDDGGNLGEVLHAAAVVQGTDDAVDSLRPAVTARLIQVVGTEIRFRHPLVRSAIRQAASDPERRAAHAALARVLVDQPDRRAWHRAASVAGPDELVASELEAAARRAQQRGALAVALAALERAAKLTGKPDRGSERLLRAAELAFELGQRERVAHLIEEAERRALGPLHRGHVTWIREMIAPRVFRTAAEVSSLVQTAEGARAHGDNDLGLNLLWLVSSRCLWTDPGPETRMRIVEATERFGSIDDDLRLLAILAYAAPVERGALVIDRLSRSQPDREGDPEATRLLGSAAAVVGAFDVAAGFLAEAVAVSRAQGRLGHLARVLVLQAWAAAQLADWDVAIPVAEEAGRFASETGESLWEAGAQVVKATVAGMRGDQETTEALASEADRIGVPFGAGFMLAAAQMARGASALAAGLHAEAYEHLRRLYDPTDPAHHPFRCSRAIGDLADAAVHAGRGQDARAVLNEQSPLAEQTPSPWFHIGLRYARALLADDKDAEALFQAALDADLTRWPYDRARLLLAYGTWLRRQRRVAESRAPLRAARDGFDALGAVAWGERARRELRASGETSRQRTPGAWDQLTPQELQIAQMAAEGLTNREIGQQLYLSHRTVGSHLYRIFPKVGITSRAQLRAVLDRSIVSPA
jgi:DNA-binding CsgD family transcriptional regulator/tetratricopeptide (TPR) repeat protein